MDGVVTEKAGYIRTDKTTKNYLARVVGHMRMTTGSKVSEGTAVYLLAKQYLTDRGIAHE